jgi:hypothetical protein
VLKVLQIALEQSNSGMIRHIHQTKQNSYLINSFTGKRHIWGLKEPILCEKQHCCLLMLGTLD